MGHLGGFPPQKVADFRQLFELKEVEIL